MGKPYRNPPLIEAVCEFRFDGKQPWDWTLPGLVYAKIQDRYPVKKQVKSLEVTVKSEPDLLSQAVKGSVERMQFVSRDESALVQIGPDLLSVNQLKPYRSWPAFRADIVAALGIYREIAEPQAIKRVGLRYINRVDVEESAFQIEDYLTPTPNLPKTIPEEWISFLTRVHAVYPDHERALMLTIGTAPRPEPKFLSYVLDLDLTTLEGKAPSLESLARWIDQAHDDLEAAFEASITDRARGLFNRVK